MTRRRLPVLLASAALVALAACAPGGGDGDATDTKASDVDKDVAGMGDITLTVWDQEVRGGQAAQIKQLNAEFQKTYPNVTIKRVSRSFDDLRKTLRLAITNDEAPDVVQANNGRSDMGQFVKAGLLRPLDGYAEAYGWDDRYPDSIKALSSYTKDGKDFGEGDLYGLPPAGELVGLWYSKSRMSKAGIDEVPGTTAELEDALAKAEAAGETPIQFGNLDGWPGIHDFGFVQNQFVPRDEIRDLGFGREGASWTSDQNEQAATTFADWAKQGYFTKDFNGLGYDAAWQDYAKGEGVFLVAGTWLLADLQKAMGDDLGFALPPAGEDTQSVTGGTGLPFAVTEASKHADAAAAYIDFITNEKAMSLISDAGNLPVVDASTDGLSGAQADVVGAWTKASDDDTIVPYLDYATPDMYDLVVAQVQKLGAGSQDPSGFTEALEKEYSSFTGGE